MFAHTTAKTALIIPDRGGLDQNDVFGELKLEACLSGDTDWGTEGLKLRKYHPQKRKACSFACFSKKIVTYSSFLENFSGSFCFIDLVNDVSGDTSTDLRRSLGWSTSR